MIEGYLKGLSLCGLRFGVALEVCSRKLQRRVLRQIASPIQHSITQHNITPQQDTPQQDPPQHHTPQQDIHRSKTPHLQTGLYCILIIYILNYFLEGVGSAQPSAMNPLQGSGVSERSRCGAVPILAVADEPSTGIGRVGALSLWCRAHP